MVFTWYFTTPWYHGFFVMSSVTSSQCFKRNMMFLPKVINLMTTDFYMPFDVLI